MYQSSVLNEDEQKELLLLARKTLENFVRHEPASRPGAYPEKLNEVYGVFCTICKDGRTRSRAVVGLPYPLLPLIDACMNAVTAAAGENEKPLTADELDEIKLEITIILEPVLLDAMHPAEKYFSHIVPGSDGLMLRYGVYESFMPPQAWDAIKEKEQFMEKLCKLAGLSEGMWKEPGVELYRFHAQVLAER